MGPWHIEGFDPTFCAKQMLGGVGIECIKAKMLFPLYQGKIIFFHNQMQETGHFA